MHNINNSRTHPSNSSNNSSIHRLIPNHNLKPNLLNPNSTLHNPITLKLLRSHTRPHISPNPHLTNHPELALHRSTPVPEPISTNTKVTVKPTFTASRRVLQASHPNLRPIDKGLNRAQRDLERVVVILRQNIKQLGTLIIVNLPSSSRVNSRDNRLMERVLIRRRVKVRRSMGQVGLVSRRTRLIRNLNPNLNLAGRKSRMDNRPTRRKGLMESQEAWGGCRFMASERGLSGGSGFDTGGRRAVDVLKCFDILYERCHRLTSAGLLFSYQILLQRYSSCTDKRCHQAHLAATLLHLTQSHRIASHLVASGKTSNPSRSHPSQNRK